MLTARLIVGIHRVYQENLIQDGKAAGIAGTHTENDKILMLGARVDNLDFLSFDLKINKVFDLREEKNPLRCARY